MSQFTLRVTPNGWKQTIWAHTMYAIHVSVATPYGHMIMMLRKNYNSKMGAETHVTRCEPKSDDEEDVDPKWVCGL